MFINGKKITKEEEIRQAELAQKSRIEAFNRTVEQIRSGQWSNNGVKQITGGHEILNTDEQLTLIFAEIKCWPKLMNNMKEVVLAGGNLGHNKGSTGKITMAVNISIFPNLEELNLSYNPLKHPPLVANNQSLRVLKLSNASLNTSPVLTGCSGLKELWLDGNDFPILLISVDCIELEVLNCNSSKLREAPALEAYSKLKKLHLSCNNLARPPIFDNNTELEEVHLNYNKLEYPPIVTMCSLLTTLNLAHNKIATVPNLLYCVNIINADLIDNLIPPSEYNLVTIKHKIDEHQKKLAFEAMLDKITSGQNQHSSELCKLNIEENSNLLSINLGMSDDNFSDLMSALADREDILDRLKSMYINENKITFFTGAPRFPSLQSIIACNNPLGMAPSSEQFPFLQDINLSNCNLRSPLIFSGFKHLKRLSLQSSKVRRPPIIEGCDQLNSLDISNNELNEAPDLFGCTSLAQLTLSQNNLRSAPKLYDHATNLNVSLHSNPLTDADKYEISNNIEAHWPKTWKINF